MAVNPGAHPTTDAAHAFDADFIKKPTPASREGSTRYPYLLRGLREERGQVWCADITYIAVRRGFLYLVAIMDWATRHVLAWRLSNTMDARFCIEALNEALAEYGRPEIFNTDQGSQLPASSSPACSSAQIAISMDGRGRCLDNVFIERLWRSLKYEAVYLGIGDRIAGKGWRRPADRLPQHRRPHSALGGQPPAVVYFNSIETDQQARRQ